MALVITSKPVTAVIDPLEVCVTDGKRTGIDTLLSYRTTGDLHHRVGETILAHVARGRVQACEVPSYSSLFYLECSPDLRE